ncbi:MAG: hypothetical protein M1423_02040 [Acidobacteria bacterium]|nr:hypothetical protein [Acidobacteriota bacterium]
MAANRKQGSYLSVFLTSFTGFVAGLCLWLGGDVGIGILVTIVSFVLLVYSLFGLRGIKHLEFTDMG